MFISSSFSDSLSNSDIFCATFWRPFKPLASLQIPSLMALCHTTAQNFQFSWFMLHPSIMRRNSVSALTIRVPLLETITIYCRNAALASTASSHTVFGSRFETFEHTEPHHNAYTVSLFHASIFQQTEQRYLTHFIILCALTFNPVFQSGFRECLFTCFIERIWK